LFREHGLALYNLMDTARYEQPVNDLIVFGFVKSPVDRYAILFCVLFKVNKVIIQIGENVLLYLRSNLTQFLPVLDRPGSKVAFIAHQSKHFVMPLDTTIVAVERRSISCSICLDIVYHRVFSISEM